MSEKMLLEEDIERILQVFERPKNVVPRKELNLAARFCEQFSPRLLTILEVTFDDPEFAVEEAGFAATFALYLLASFREKAAYPVAVGLSSLPGELPFHLFGDTVTQDLDRILASLACGDTSHIQALVEDSEANEYARGGGLRALTLMVGLKELDRAWLVDYMRTLFTEKLERVPSHVWDALVTEASRLWPGELEEEIAKCFREDLVDLFFITPKNVREELDAGLDACMAQLAKCKMLITDVEADVSYWSQWSINNRNIKLNPHTSRPDGAQAGKNEACPCNSGRRYGKCCGRKFWPKAAKSKRKKSKKRKR